MSESATASPTGLFAATSFSVVGQAIAFASNFVAGVIIARALGPQGKGDYTVITSGVTLVSAACLLGMTSAIVYFVGRHGWPPVRTAGLAWALSCALLGAVLVGVGIGGPTRLAHAARLSPDAMRWLWLMLVFGVPLEFLGTHMTAALRGREAVLPAVGSAVARSISRLALMAVALLALGSGLGGAVRVDIATTALAAVLLTATAFRLFGFGSSQKAAVAARPLLAYGSRLQVTVLASMLLARSDIFLVNYLLDRQAAGVYSIAMLVPELLALPALAVYFAVLPRLTAVGAGERQETALLVHRLLTVASVFLAVGLAGAALLIPYIYGARFAGAIAPAWILLPGCLALQGQTSISNYLQAEGRPLAPAAGLFAGCAVMIGVDLLAIPHLGISGAAVGYSLGLIVSYVFTAVLVRRTSGPDFLRTLLVRGDDLQLLRAAFSRRGASQRAPLLPADRESDQ